jgi:hypothetical protein
VNTTPACRNHGCVACTANTDCDGGQCLPTGSCAAADAIIHATSNGAIAMPCGDTGTPCTLTVALAAASATKNVIKLDDAGPYVPDTSASATNFVIGSDVTIDARGATLHRRVDGPLVVINDSKTVAIYGGTIEDAVNGDGILCRSGATLTIEDTKIDLIDRSAINATGCKPTIIHATISNSSLKTPAVESVVITAGSITLSRSSFLKNSGGALKVTNTDMFSIVGNSFMNNGGGSDNQSPSVSISTAANDNNRFEFNTIAYNKAQGGRIAGLDCRAGNAFVASNNIIWMNDGPLQFNGGIHTYSDIGPLVTVVPGTGNIKEDPLLTSDTDPHLQPGSAALTKANPAADISGIAAKDIDGDTRAGPIDMGADQASRP